MDFWPPGKYTPAFHARLSIELHPPPLGCSARIRTGVGL